MVISVFGNTDDSFNLSGTIEGKWNGTKKVEYLIRYGDRKLWKGGAVLCFNSIEAIENARHKYKTLKIFERNGIPVVPYGLTTKGLIFPVLGRKFFHYCGRDIRIIKLADKIPKCDYYVQFMPPDVEFRYHILGTLCIAATEKYGGMNKCYCRNNESGWRYKDIEPDPYLTELSILATKSLGLHFGAVDILISEGNPYILEVNTAPGLNKKRLKIYTKEIKWYINEVEKQKKQFENVKRRGGISATYFSSSY